MSEENWDVLIKRLIIMRCGEYVDEIKYGMMEIF
jgi:hypothetical protein